ncbi:Cytochrome c oxidase subunit 3 [Aphelenchoides besseyi]|nr:Cytochrome c oxidase subunit 3 [Aphelenchoides besseyi]
MLFYVLSLISWLGQCLVESPYLFLRASIGLTSSLSTFDLKIFVMRMVLIPVHDLGETWSPIGLHLVNPFGVPLLNTIILLRRGVTNIEKLVFLFLMVVFLGEFFICLLVFMVYMFFCGGFGSQIEKLNSKISYILIFLFLAHVEAPTSASIILAGLLLKFGTGGFFFLLINLCLYREFSGAIIIVF